MPLYKADAIVLKANNLREADKIITLYTKQYGKIPAIAKGLRKIKSKFASSLEMFNVAEVMLYIKENRNLATITGCSLNKSSYKLRQDIIKMSSASLVVELTDKLTRENQVNVRVFRLLKVVLDMMETEDVHILVLFFMIHLFSSLGYKLHLGSCVSCGSSNFTSAKFSNREGGILCPHCYFRDYNSIGISTDCIIALRKLARTHISKIKYVPVIKQARRELKKVLDFYLYSHLSRKLSSSEFIEKLEMAML